MGQGLWKWLMGVMVAVAAGPAWAVAPLPVLPVQDLCRSHSQAVEAQYGIPAHLLDAISLVESGRWDASHQASLAWPWTVSSGGDGKYFPTKAEAIAEVRRLRAKGIKNIDVGCMQVNMMYHPEAFVSLDEAFDPEANMAYAARFLVGLHQSTGQWLTAASYYHSQTPSLAAEYRHKLEKIWDGVESTARAVVQVARNAVPSVSTRIVPPTTTNVAWHRPVMAPMDEAKSIAEAYRQARMAEYMLKRQKMIEHRETVHVARGNW